jgi:transposase InsO family protein
LLCAPRLISNFRSSPDFVWSTDITYIRLAHGFGYLVAIMDWFSRYVLAWRLSNSLETHFCLEALEEALEHSHPAIFNTDQGAQFTSLEFTSRLERQGVQISMDGRRRALGLELAFCGRDLMCQITSNHTMSETALIQALPRTLVQATLAYFRQ